MANTKADESFKQPTETTDLNSDNNLVSNENSVNHIEENAENNSDKNLTTHEGAINNLVKYVNTESDNVSEQIEFSNNHETYSVPEVEFKDATEPKNTDALLTAEKLVEETSGCCGRKKTTKEKIHLVGTFDLYKFASKLDILLLVIGSVAAVALGCAIPTNIAVFGEVINVFIHDDTYFNDTSTNSTHNRNDFVKQDLLPYIFGFIGIAVASFTFAFLAVSFWLLATERQMNQMRKRFFQAVLKQDIGWFDVHQAGEISSRFSEDVSKISDGMGDKVAIFLQWIATFIACLIMAFTRHWKLSLATCAFSPVIIWSGRYIVKVMRSLAIKEFRSYAKAGAAAEQAFRSVRTVQAFEGQEKEIQRYDDNLITAVRVGTKKGVAIGLGNSVLWFIIFFLFSVIMWFGTYLVQTEHLPPGRVLPVFFGIMVGSFSLGNAFNNLESFSNARAAAAKVFDIISLKPLIDSSSDKGKTLQNMEGNIVFNDIYFSYPSRPNIQVLEKFNLEVKSGEHIALVGPSGCGKSTIVQLLQRFYDPSGGEVTVDGNDIKDVNLKWYRNQLGVVSQEPVLFDTTIEDNIRFGKIDATTEEIYQAAKEANAHDFIQLLPEGYKTNVGERGAQLSGGQKQRIAIARALIRNPKVLIFDEATSALDHESESIVQSALEKAEIGRTTITIAHRLSTVRHADKIIVMSEGSVVEQGTHDDLMCRKGVYYQLVEIQSKMGQEGENEILAETASVLSLRSIISNNNAPIVSDFGEMEIVVEGEDDLTTESSPFKRSISAQSNGNKYSKNIRESTRKLIASKFSKRKSKPEVETENVPEVSLGTIAQYNASEWPLILTGCLSSVVAGAFHPAFSFLLSEYIKILSMKDNEKQMNQTHILAGSVVGVAVVSGIIRMLQGYCFQKSGSILTARLRKLCFSSLIYQDIDYFDQPQNQVGSLTTKLATDASFVQGATGSKLGQILEALSTLVTALVIALIFGWKLTLVIIIFLPIMVGAGIVQGKVVAGATMKDKPALLQAGKICSEAVNNIRTIASLNREDYFLEKFNAVVDEMTKTGKKTCWIYGITYGVSNCMIFFAYAVTFYYGSVLVADGEMQFHDVFRVFSAIIFGGTMVGRNSSFGVDYSKAKMAAARIIADINRKPKIDCRDAFGEQIKDFKGNISFHDAVFRYSRRPKIAVLDNLNLSVKAGESVALVGTSGCGKSTSMQLIKRFYDLDTGVLKADDKDIKDLNLAWYRRQFGLVSQEPTLFDCSIAENIAYGDNSRVVPMQDIIDAATASNIHSFIASLPQGYDTNVGDKGAQLSGGQKQRIAIARALIRNPKILLLDEATSALDSESEKIVQDALDRASKERTSIIIAHRLSTIQNVDKIAVLRHGQIIEVGTHAKLMSQKGAYYELYNAQKRYK